MKDSTNILEQLPYEVKERFERIKRENREEDIEVLIRVINTYDLSSYEDLKHFKELMIKRIGLGVNKSFLIELKIIYTYLGHFLKKIRYIK